MRLHLRLTLLISLILSGTLIYLLGFSQVFVVKEIKIGIKDKEIATRVEQMLAQPPAVVELGDQIARVDRRQLANRLRQFALVENVEVDRNLISGRLLVKVFSRSPIARLTSTTSPQSANVGFMDSGLDYFYLPRQDIDQAISSGDLSWQQIPELTLPATTSGEEVSQLRAGARELIELFGQELAAKGFALQRVSARDGDSFITSANYSGRSIEISWGNTSDLGLKVEVIQRLLALDGNETVRRINLRDPLKPTAR
ncbi:MAG: hypothetical protein FJW91_03425 [Actinobacteria bacterium]|nr:hypothetical protein [Actinomycetota bacterium]